MGKSNQEQQETTWISRKVALVAVLMGVGQGEQQETEEPLAKK